MITALAVIGAILGLLLIVGALVAVCLAWESRDGKNPFK